MENANDPKGRKPENVKKMFSRVAAHYDVINRAMCGGLDVIWRKRLVNAAVSGARADGEKKFLDIACGSGDVCAEFLKRDASCRVTGVDFCPEMLEIARKKFPGAKNNLDALCKRFNVDNSRRTKHGALLDAELLAEVYLELLGGAEPSMLQAEGENREKTGAGEIVFAAERKMRPQRFFPVSAEEEAEHLEFLQNKLKNAWWLAGEETAAEAKA